MPQQNSLSGSVQDQLRETFALIDVDGDGFVTIDELNGALKEIGGVSHGMAHHLQAKCPDLQKIACEEWDSMFFNSSAADRQQILSFGAKLARRRSDYDVRPGILKASHDGAKSNEEIVEAHTAKNESPTPGAPLKRHSLLRRRATNACFRPIRFLSPFRLCWDIAMAILLVYIAITAPYMHAFGLNDPSVCYANLASKWITKMDLVIDACFMVDIALNFITTFPDRKGNEVTDSYRIVTNYLRTWFALDAISSIPLDCISSGMPLNLQPAKLLKLSKITKVFRFVRLSKAVKLSHGSLAETFDDFLVQSSVQNVLKIVHILFTSAVICHWLACLMAISGPGFLREYDDESSVIIDDSGTYEGPARHANKWSSPRRYLAALYWALMTMTTVGFGDIVPHSDSERAATMLAMVLGCGFYGFVIAEMSSIVVTRDVKTRRFYEKLDTIGAWLDHHELPLQYRERVLRYLRAHYRKRTALDEHAILDDLSPELREELIKHLVPRAIIENPLFESLPSGTLAHLTPIIFTTVKNTNDYVVRSGQPGEGMFVIANGNAVQRGSSVFDTNVGSSTVRQLSAGDSFGEHVLLGLEKSYTYTVEAICPLEMYTIPTEEFLKCFKGMPDILARIKTNLIGADINGKDAQVRAELATDGVDQLCLQSALVPMLPKLADLIASKLAQRDVLGKHERNLLSGETSEEVPGALASLRRRMEHIENTLNEITNDRASLRKGAVQDATSQTGSSGLSCLDPLLFSVKRSHGTR